MCPSPPQACRAECEELCGALHPVGSTSLELLARGAAAARGNCTIRILLALRARRNLVTWWTWCLELGGQ